MAKRISLLLTVVLLCGLLCACGQTTFRPKIQVTLVETNGFSVEENGIWIYPGQNVCFTLQMHTGWELTDADYDGSYYIWKENGVTKLELRNVCYPTRVTPEVTGYNRRITYDPNGGAGEITAVTYNISVHTRPNTAIGTDLFSRDGYTLTGWNTAPDGSGTRVGLGSRITVPEAGITLYAQWASWTATDHFSYASTSDGIRITGYHGADRTVVVPEYIEALPVTEIAAGAFAEAPITAVILPKSLRTVEDGAFSRSTLESVLLFDNIETVSDAGFVGCEGLKTLYINAIEAPYGYAFRRESMYADKVDLLINAQGQKKAVFYGGCSMWYNLNGQTAQNALPDYKVINMGLNGTVNSDIQLQILSAFLEPGDVFFHTPELSSDQQFLTATDMDHNAEILWAGLEYNYDLVSLVDIRLIENFFGSFRDYLAGKSEETNYRRQYTDSDGNTYLDSTGSLPFDRIGQTETLPEEEAIHLDLEILQSRDLSRLQHFYENFSDRDIHVYVSYACLLYSSVPEDQQENVAAVDSLLRNAIGAMDGPVLVSTLWDFLYDREEFYNSAYHLQSAAVDSNTAVWLRDLKKQMTRDGLLPSNP